MSVVAYWSAQAISCENSKRKVIRKVCHFVTIAWRFASYLGATLCCWVLPEDRSKRRGTLAPRHSATPLETRILRKDAIGTRNAANCTHICAEQRIQVLPGRCQDIVSTVVTGRCQDIMSTVVTGKCQDTMSTVVTGRCQDTMSTVVTGKCQDTMSTAVTGKCQDTMTTVVTGKCQDTMSTVVTGRCQDIMSTDVAVCLNIASSPVQNVPGTRLL